MKTTTTLLSILATGIASATNYDIIISPTYTAPERKQALAAAFDLAITEAKLGDTFRLLDAKTLTPVCTIALPADDPVLANPRARATRFRPQVAALAALLKTEPLLPEAGAIPGEVHLPRLFDSLAQTRGSEAEETHLILVAQPFHHEAADPAFDFGPEQGDYPSDGLLASPKSESIFSTADSAGSLAKVTVHWAYVTEKATNAYHGECVGRFWSSYLHTRGATLATFTLDPKAATGAALKGRTTPCFNHQPDLAAKPMIMRAKRIRVEATESQAAVDEALPAFMTSSAAITTTRVKLEKAPIKIGLTWADGGAGAIDLDLYVKPTPSSKEISYRRVRTAEGTLYKDFQQSPQVAQSGFETVETIGEVDLRGVSAWVNFYAGEANAGVEATLRLSVDDQVFEKKLKLSGNAGNKGNEASPRSEGPHWIQVPVREILGL
jgi:hypothetical protein